jgi:HSP20 family protein
MLNRWTNFDRTLAAMDDLRRRMDRVFEEEGAPRARYVAREEPERTWGGRAATFPRVNFYDQSATLVMTAEVPGLSEKDVELTVHHDVLTLKGARRPDAPEGYSVHRQERAPVQFARSFTLPCKVDADKVSATVKDGILTVTLAKSAEAQPRQITVRAS